MHLDIDVNMDLRELYKAQDYLGELLQELVNKDDLRSRYDIVVSLEGLITDIIHVKEKLGI